MNENSSTPPALENQGKEPEKIQQPTLLERFGEILLRIPKTREQLIYSLRECEQRHIITPDTLSMIEGVIQVSDMQVREVMIPRTQMIVIDQEQKPADFLTTVVESAHSRFPVLGDTQHEVVGILLAKDLLTHFTNSENNKFNMRDILRPAVFIPESKRLNVLLTEFAPIHLQS